MRIRRTGVFLLLSVALSCGSGRGTATGGHPSRAQRVVCATPALTEIVFALGCQDRVVAVSDFSDYPPEVALKPRIGGYVDLNRELLLALGPDLILTQGRHEHLASFARRHGMRLQSFSLETLADLFATIRALGQLLAVPDRAESLAASVRAGLEAIEATSRAAARPSVLLVVGRTPGDFSSLTTVGGGTFLDELVEVAGGRNVFKDASGSYPEVSKEAVLERDPDVIIELRPKATAQIVEGLLRDWRSWGVGKAVRAGRVHVLTADHLLIPGPRVTHTARLLHEILHPTPATP